jgi:hypothetical protein
VDQPETLPAATAAQELSQLLQMEALSNTESLLKLWPTFCDPLPPESLVELVAAAAARMQQQ